MSIGRYFKDFASIQDMINDLEEQSDHLGQIECFDISLHEEKSKFGIILSPRRSAEGDTVCLSTGDNAVGVFETRSAMGHKLNEVLAELKSRDYKTTCKGLPHILGE